MRRPTIIHFTLIILAGATCGFADDKLNQSPFPGARPLPEDVVQPLFPHLSEAEAEIYRKLNTNTSVAFDKIPLKEALDFISKTNKIPLIIDIYEAEESAFAASSTVTLQVQNVPLRTVVKNMLRQLELESTVADDVLYVIDEGTLCNPTLSTGVFPVGDIVTDGRKSWKNISRLLEHETDGLWERTDGSGGTISISRATKSLVIRQTPNVLIEIQSILTFLRAANESANIG